MIKAKYKSKVTGKEVAINDVYMNNSGAIELIEVLYENSSEWIKTYPIDETNISEIAKNFSNGYFSEIGGVWTGDFKDGFIKGVEIYIKNLFNKK